MVVFVVGASPFLAALEASAADGGKGPALPVAANARALPPISMLAADPLGAQEPPLAEAQLFDDSPFDPRLLVLAAWLPLAGAMLAVASEDSSPSCRPAGEPGGEPSLD